MHVICCCAVLEFWVKTLYGLSGKVGIRSRALFSNCLVIGFQGTSSSFTSPFSCMRLIWLQRLPLHSQVLRVLAVARAQAQEWVDIESADLPHFDTENVLDYFVERCVSDGAKANDNTNGKWHAYPLFKAGHVQSILVSHNHRDITSSVYVRYPVFYLRHLYHHHLAMPRERSALLKS
jgi:hypothetical protein